VRIEECVSPLDGRAFLVLYVCVEIMGGELPMLDVSSGLDVLTDRVTLLGVIDAKLYRRPTNAHRLLASGRVSVLKKCLQGDE
jgi:hypothetical protein